MQLEDFKKVENGDTLVEGENHVVIVEGKTETEVIYFENGEECRANFKDLWTFEDVFNNL